METAGSPVLSNHTIQRWDLDKTYLVSNTESLRGLLRIPFERAQDKQALPGVAALIKQLRRTAAERGVTTSVNFVTASPPQIGRAIREKLFLDGIEIDEIRFKNQIQHLVRGRFDALREHVGFKLSELLLSARAGRRDGEELLFGDDWESDPLIYSLYADTVEERLLWPQLQAHLHRAGVEGQTYLDTIRECTQQTGPRRRVTAICVLRARPRSGEDFEPFGARLFWFDNYLESALILHALGCLDARGVVEVASASELDQQAVAASFEAVAGRWPSLRREHVTVARRALMEAELLPPTPGGSWWRQLLVRWRIANGRPPLTRAAPSSSLPDYARLVQEWAYRPRKDPEPTHDPIEESTDEPSQ